MIPLDGASDHGVDVLRSIVIQVTESDAMALVQLPEAAGGCHVLKTQAAIVSEHPAGDQCAQIRIARPQVEVEPAVVVEIAEVGAHAQ